jgi:two-component system sensor histidine kinase AlgZ
MLKAFLGRQSLLIATSLFVVIGLAVFFFVEISSQFLLSDIYGSFSWNQLMMRMIVAAIIIGLVVRAFFMQSRLDAQVRSEAEHRFSALQAKIRPHFLFNCLNTIAELTVERPEDAEHAINSLAMLFRATLETDNNRFSLDREITLCKRYIGLEKWRYGDRLNVNWYVEVDGLSNLLVPKLILQPLLENAVVYGVQQNGVIDIEVDIRETKSQLSIRIHNVKGTEKEHEKSNGIAMANIKERLFVMYDDEYTFKVDDKPDTYCVIMRFPKEQC